MLHLFVRYLSPLLLTLAPLMTSAEYSLLDMAGLWPRGAPTASVLGFPEGPKHEVEMKARAMLTLVGYLALVLSGYFDLYRPARSLVKFRSDLIAFLNEHHWRRAGLRIPKGVRINVMYVRWRLRRPLGRSFEVGWRDGFEAKHQDGDIRLYTWQGACGEARTRRDACFVDFRLSGSPDAPRWWQRWFWFRPFRLTRSQRDRTSHLVAILSVPIFEISGPSGKEKQRCVGVINLDAVTASDAEYLQSHADALAKALAQHGTLIARVR